MLARPSLCSLLIAASLALASIAAPTAQAAPPEPVLTLTNPVSPGASLTPRIKGLGEEEVTTHFARMTAAAGMPMAMAVDPDNTITLYEEDPTCSNSGAIAAVGTAGELQGTGIQVSVSPDSKTTFYANQTDGSGTSSCSKGIVYRQVTTPPQPPLFASTSPSSPADDNFPRLIGSADPESSVSIYANASCSGGPVGTGSGAEFAAGGVPASVADNTTTTFHATATLAGISSACSSSSISYQEVTPPKEEGPGGDPGGKGPGGGVGGEPSPPDVPGRPPAPRLRTAPAGPANNNTPLVTGTAPGAATVKIFSSEGCKGAALVKGSASELSSGLRVQVVDNDTTTFYGVSVDGGGDESPCSPTPAVYVEDSTAPRTRITMGPGVKTRRRTAVFRFLDIAGETPGTTYLCKLDRRGWRACESPYRARRLTRRRHLFQVKAVDLAGNQEQKPVRRGFKVVR